MKRNQRRLSDVTFLAFDTETTGLQPIVHRLVEIGVVCFRLDGHEIATFQQLIDPQVPIPPDVQQVHGITDAMVRGQPIVDQILPRFIKFLGPRDTILLAHNAPFDLGFLAMGLTRLGIVYPLHSLFDTLEMTRQLYPTWPSHSLDHVASWLNVAYRAEHRALPDALLVEEIFLAMLNDMPTVNTIAEVMRVSPPLTFVDAAVFAIEPPPGFEAHSTAIAARCAITIVYGHGWPQPQPRMITPRLVLEVQGVAYVIAHCHLSHAERTFRSDRIRACWLA